MKSRTINKIIRDFFSAQPPFFVNNLNEQKSIITHLKKEIKEQHKYNIKIDESKESYFNQKIEIDYERRLCLEIANPYKKKHTWRDHAELLISFEKENNQYLLAIKPRYGNTNYNFSGNPTDLFNFIERAQEQYKETVDNTTKSDKIKQLKKGAVLAKIKEIAKNKQFNFDLHEYHNKLKLQIQVGTTGIISIDILYSKFQQEMGKIESIVDAANTLYNSGIVANLNFRAINNGNRLKYFTKYQDL